jgi:hypothetical protein
VRRPLVDRVVSADMSSATRSARSPWRGAAHGAAVAFVVVRTLVKKRKNRAQFSLDATKEIRRCRR